MTDENMLALLGSDPSEGIRLLIDCYSSLVYKIAYSKLGNVFSPDDIEEFVSFIFSKIFERRGEIDLSRGTLKGYIVTIAKRMCIDEYRKVSSRPSTEPLTREIADTACGAYGIHEEAERAIDENALVDALNLLNSKDREILLRRYYRGQTSAQIAEELHLSDAAVRKRISRALERLKRLLSESDFSYY